MNRILSALLVLAIGIGGCKGSNKLTTTATSGKKEKRSECDKVFSGSTPHISWYGQDDEILKNSSTPIMLPKDHSLYSIDTAGARAFFMAGKTGIAETAIPLPEPLGCKVFSFSNSSTMSKELQEKYPDIVALKGMEVASKSGDARLDYNGKMLQGQIIWNKDVYMVTSIFNNNQYYYVVYKKADVIEKEPFERPKQPNEIQRLKVDR